MMHDSVEDSKFIYFKANSIQSDNHVSKNSLNTPSPNSC